MRRSTLALFTALIATPFFCMTASAQLAFTQQTYTTSGGTAILRADFNNDGIPDLLVYNGPKNDLQVFLGNGNGTFQPPVSTAAPGATPYAVATDYNLDGKVDLVTCSAVGNTGQMTLALWFGDGAGHFTQAASLNSPCHGLAVADFNNDGKPDIAVAISTNDSTSANPVPSDAVIVHLGTGSNTFGDQIATAIPTITEPSGGTCHVVEGLAAGDFNKDRIRDVVVPLQCWGGSSPTNVGMLAFGAGNGSGVFSFSAAGQTGDLSRFRAADINEDSSLDVLGASYSGGPHGSYNLALSLLTNQGSGTFTGKDVETLGDYSSTYQYQISAGTVADVNGDGIKDAVVAEDYTTDTYSTPTTPYLTFLLQDSSGNFGAPQRWQLPGHGTDVLWGDFDSDGHQDLAVVTNTNQLVIFLNNGRYGGPNCPRNTSQMRFVEVCFIPSPDGSSIQLQANPTDSRLIDAMQVYIDGVLTFETPDDIINHVFALTPGGHDVVVKAWDNLGAFSNSVKVGYASNQPCAATTDRTVAICSPVPGSTVTSPVQFSADALDYEHPVTAMKLYVNGTAMATSSTHTLAASLVLSPGTYKATFRAWDASGYYFSSSESFTVGSSSSPPPAQVAITANPSTITAGQSSTLTVNAQYASTVTVTGSDGSHYSVSPNGGNLTVTPASTTTYTATATNSAVQSTTASTTVTVSASSGGGGGGGGACTATTDRTVSICSPAAGSTVNSPVQFTAAALDNEHPVTAMKLYVDSVVKATSSSSTLSASVPLASGTHHVTVRAWDTSGYYFSSSETITVP